ncbi:MAG: glycosyltransferase [Lachnospiraceae bacterium]|nr:glycosyltransferase [Lachnospiraceae bacterium]
MPKVSIVIPIYNTEEYLRGCLDSVVNQTLRDIEIILVDDGSTDGSADICREYAAKDSRIIFFTQENAGAASARRAGTKVATGKYIGFVDSDDFIEEDMYETLLSYLNDCDLVTSAIQKEDGAVWKDNLAPGQYRSLDEMQYIIDNMLVIGNSIKRGITCSMVSKVFLTDLARLAFENVNLQLHSGEDFDFIFRYVLLCKSICITNICKYHYRKRENSRSHYVNHAYMANVSDLYLSLRKVFIGHNCEKRLLEQLQMLMTRTMIETIPVRMEFAWKAKMIQYISPLFNKLKEKKVALYGAGLIGKDFYLHMVRMGQEPVMWVDKQYESYQEEYPVFPVEALQRTEYEVLLIAVKKQELAEKIKQELMAIGIEQEKIQWEEPIKVM